MSLRNGNKIVSVAFLLTRFKVCIFILRIMNIISQLLFKIFHGLIIRKYMFDEARTILVTLNLTVREGIWGEGGIFSKFCKKLRWLERLKFVRG